MTLRTQRRWRFPRSVRRPSHRLTLEDLDMHHFRISIAALALAAAIPLASSAADAPVDPQLVQKLEQRLDDMQQELAAMKSQIRELKSQNEALAADRKSTRLNSSHS